MAGHGRRRTIGLALALGVGMAVAVGGSLAQSAAAPADAIAARQANFKQLGGAFKALNDQLKAETPDMAVIKASAQKMKDLAAEEPTWFPAGSGPEAGVKTAAKPEIWTDAAGFTTAVNNLQTETGKLLAAANGGDKEAIGAQVKATGGACGGCHAKFRAKPA